MNNWQKELQEGLEECGGFHDLGCSTFIEETRDCTMHGLIFVVQKLLDNRAAEVRENTIQDMRHAIDTLNSSHKMNYQYYNWVLDKLAQLSNNGETK